MQGSLQVTLRNSASGQHIDDNEVRRKFQQFGDVKSVTPVGDHIAEYVISPGSFVFQNKALIIFMFAAHDMLNFMTHEYVFEKLYTLPSTQS